MLAVGQVRSGSERLTVQELTAYQQAIASPLREGGATVQLQIKPRLTDLDKGTVAPDVVVVESASWVRQLTRVRTAVAAAAAPPQLAGASRLFDEALVGYIRAATLFGKAAAAPPADRPELLRRGIEVATAADKTYDEASRILQRLRRQLGMGRTSEFPDPDTRNQ